MIIIRSIFTSISFAILVAGCVSETPPSEKPELQGSGTAFEQGTSKGLGKLITRRKSASIPLSPEQVQTNLAAFAKQCVDGRSVRIVSYGPRGGTSDWYFRARMQREEGVQRLLILGDQDNGAFVIGGQDGFSVMMSTSVIPNGSTTELATTHVVSWGRLHDAAARWASGNTQTCPDLTKLYGL